MARSANHSARPQAARIGAPQPLDIPHEPLQAAFAASCRSPSRAADRPAGALFAWPPPRPRSSTLRRPRTKPPTAVATFPPGTLRGSFMVVNAPEIQLDGHADRLSPGARIRSAENMLVMPGRHHRPEPAGQLHARRRRPGARGLDPHPRPKPAPSAPRPTSRCLNFWPFVAASGPTRRRQDAVQPVAQLRPVDAAFGGDRLRRLAAPFSRRLERRALFRSPS